MPKITKTAGIILAVMVSGVITNAARADLKGNLTVEVNGVRNQRGQLCVRLFSNNRGFPDGSDSGTNRQCSKITDSSMTFSFKNLAFSNYAIAVLHDENGDSKMNRNSVGMPTEGYGFSNNPAISRSGPPKYGETVFLLAGPNTTVKIRMRYVSAN